MFSTCNVHCFLVWPRLQISDDVIGEDFIVTLKPSQTIVTGDVTTPTPEHLQTLRVTNSINIHMNYMYMSC